MFYYKILGKVPFVLREDYIKLSLSRVIVQFLMCVKKLRGAIIKVQILSPYSERDSEFINLWWA